VIRRKVMRAVTDTGMEVRHDPADKPGVSNLLEILAAAGRSEEEFTSYGALKAAVVDAVVAMLAPIQRRFGELADDPQYVRGVLACGAERAAIRAGATVARAKQALGLLDPPVRRGALT
jgi:tryptophanyl-tRNA synthetase